MIRGMSGLCWVCLFACTRFLAGCATAVTFTVNTTQDLHDTNAGDLQCVADESGDLCSLRAAVEEANAFTPGTAHIVISVPAGTYSLSAEPEVQLTLNAGRFIEIRGASPASTIVQPETAHSANDGRAFHILGSLIRLENLTIRNGKVQTGEGSGIGEPGGGILIDGPGYGEINHCIIENNVGGHGGGIYARGGTGGTLSLLFRDTIIRNNEARSAGDSRHGGGLYAHPDVDFLRLTRVTIANNLSDGVNAGGGAYLRAKTVEIWDSSITQNVAGHGAGLYVDDGDLLIGRSTVSGNTLGGGIRLAAGAHLTLRDVTITDNEVHEEIGGGGGVNAVGGDISVTIRNSILAGNRRGNTPSDCNGTITSNGHNFIGSNLDCTFQSQDNDQIGTADAPLNPHLQPLALNGGPTMNHVPESDSPVIDAGSGCDNVDQRGQVRPRDGNGDNVAVCDIGAVERQPGLGIDPGGRP